MPQITFTFDVAGTIQLILAVLLPILVGLATTRVTSPRIKAFLLAGLSIVSSLLTEFLAAAENGTAYDLGQGLITALFTFIMAVGLHYGLYKPTGAAAAAQNALSGKTPPQGETTDGPDH